MGLNARAAPAPGVERIATFASGGCCSRTFQSRFVARDVPNSKLVISLKFSVWLRVMLPRSWHCCHSGGRHLDRKEIALLSYCYCLARCRVYFMGNSRLRYSLVQDNHA
jgi:hypothetical protein